MYATFRYYHGNSELADTLVEHADEVSASSAASTGSRPTT
jgi:hypothetical protein